MKILIVEDEITLAKRLARLTSEILGKRVTKIKVLDNLDEADDYINEHTIDLMLLDLNLQSRDGFQLLRQSVAGSFHTIVVSANIHRAIEAFEYGALDFVAKPFTKPRLEIALKRYGTNQSNPDENATSVRFLSVRRHGLLEIVAVDNVNYIKGANNYSELFLDNGTTRLHNKSLTKLAELLPSNFDRVHKSYIVPMNRVNRLEASSYASSQLILEDSSCIPVSRAKAKELRYLYKPIVGGGPP